MFNYPIDAKYIMRKKVALKRKLTSLESSSKLKIAVLGGSTTASIVEVLELFLLHNGIEAVFYESDYNKFYEDAVYDIGALSSFKPNIVYVHTSVKNIVNFPEFNSTDDDVFELEDTMINKYINVWDALTKFDCSIIQNNFEHVQYRSMGNLDFYDKRGKTHFINSLNLKIAKEARNRKNLFINDINHLSAFIGLSKWYDNSLWHRAKYALSFDAMPELAKNLTNIICSIIGKSNKCLVLDLDNTLWGGVIGDDGVDGIKIGRGDALSETYLELQTYIKELKERGITLAICSKNEQSNALAGLDHPNGVLKQKDFAAIRANWNPKDQNITDIASELNIGVDSFVFMDDNSAERNLVQSNLPSVNVPDIGHDAVDFLRHIDRNGFFEPVSLSDEDLLRAEYYSNNAKRIKTQSLYNSYDEYLKSLEMTLEVGEFNDDYLDRITQLVNKTNQFNLTTQRYSSNEISQIKICDKTLGLYGKLVDKFGDNGLITVIIGRIDVTSIHIDLWVMSCRVFKRSVEYSIMDELVLRCKKLGVNNIYGKYIPTAKNAIVSDLYESLGFRLVTEENGTQLWGIKVDEYKKQNEVMEVSNGK